MVVQKVHLMEVYWMAHIFYQDLLAQKEDRSVLEHPTCRSNNNTLGIENLGTILVRIYKLKYCLINLNYFKMSGFEA
jgi:hypothetical protein